MLYVVLYWLVARWWAWSVVCVLLGVARSLVGDEEVG